MRLQGSDLCEVTGIRALYGYRVKYSIRLHESGGLCEVTGIRTL